MNFKPTLFSLLVGISLISIQSYSINIQPGTVIEIKTESDFQHIKSQNKVIIDFHATWCGPCKALAPRLNNIAKKYKNKGIIVVKIDVDQLSSVATYYNISSIPTIIFMNNGGVAKIINGAVSESALESTIQSLNW